MRRLLTTILALVAIAACGGSSFGDACASDSECGSGSFCNAQNVCTRYCVNPEDCGDGFTCIEWPTGTTPACVKKCTAPSDCAGQTTCKDPCGAEVSYQVQCLGYTVCI